MSWKPEIQADASGEWVANGLVFATQAEGDGYCYDLQSRWTAVRKFRVVKTDLAVTHRWHDRKLEDVK